MWYNVTYFCKPGVTSMNRVRRECSLSKGLFVKPALRLTVGNRGNHASDGEFNRSVGKWLIREAHILQTPVQFRTLQPICGVVQMSADAQRTPGVNLEDAQARTDRHGGLAAAWERREIQSLVVPPQPIL